MWKKDLLFALTNSRSISLLSYTTFFLQVPRVRFILFYICSHVTGAFSSHAAPLWTCVCVCVWVHYFFSTQLSTKLIFKCGRRDLCQLETCFQFQRELEPINTVCVSLVLFFFFFVSFIIQVKKIVYKKIGNNEILCVLLIITINNSLA